MKSEKIAIAGTSYVGLSNGLFWVQHNEKFSLSPDLLSLSTKQR